MNRLPDLSYLKIKKKKKKIKMSSAAVVIGALKGNNENIWRIRDHLLLLSVMMF